MTADFNEAWLRAYQARTGCGAREYGRGSTSSVSCADTFPKGGGKKRLHLTRELSAKPTEGEKPRPKYGNRKTQVDGITFDSKHESEVYAELKLRRRAGEIAALAMQVRFRLGERIEYVADFVAIDASGAHVIDAKSEATRRDKVYRIKKKLMREKWGIEIEEV